MILLRSFGRPAPDEGGTGETRGFALPDLFFDPRVTMGLQIFAALILAALIAGGVLTQTWWLLCAAPMLLLPLIVLVVWLFYTTRSRVILPAQLLASDDHLHRGSTFEVMLRQDVRRDVIYDRIKVQIIMREWVRFESSPQPITETFDHIIREHEELGPVDASPRQSLERRIVFDLPAYLMHSFHGKNNRIRWFVRVTIDVRNTPGSTHYYHLEVPAEGTKL